MSITYRPKRKKRKRTHGFLKRLQPTHHPPIPRFAWNGPLKKEKNLKI